MKRFSPYLWVGAAGLFLSAQGCTLVPDYEIMVNGYLDETQSQAFTPGTSFHLLPGENEENPLLDKTVQTRIQKLLDAGGYTTTDLAGADYCVRFFYGAASIPHRETEFEPYMWGSGFYRGGRPRYPWTYSSGGEFVTYTHTEADSPHKQHYRTVGILSNRG